ncbi:MAG: hypothetical protein AB7Q01_14650 [Gammaproteobacteria bacterium]
MPAIVQQTFIRAGEISAPVESCGGVHFWARGLDTSNTVNVQRSIDGGVTWADVAAYDSDQAAVVIAESTVNAQHRVVCSAKVRTGAAIRIKLSNETGNVNAPE